ncbi:ethylmalonyl-CoA decarboxylase-like [Oratosquilla oratoria]|uniref:ethylmalonyl-CoA decarboxylase-like n=1 Tax=Oratosquilla oratoria TaxID=337810 RepID=UPI003F769B2B
MLSLQSAFHQGAQAATKYWAARQCSSATIAAAKEKLACLGNGDVLLTKDQASGIATVTVSNETKKNAFSGKMMVQLCGVMDELEAWTEGRGVILQSAGNAFCSGGDLTTVRNISNPSDGFLMSSLMHHTLTRFYCLPFITVTLVQGKAIGGGAELATLSDFRLFTHKGEVAFVQAKMGVVTGWGGGTRLVKLVGAKQALHLMASCSKLNAEKALEIGFADGIVDHENRNVQTHDWLAQYTSHDPEVVQAMKRIVIGGRDLSLADSLCLERNIFAPLWGGPANQKALSQNIKHK